MAAFQITGSGTIDLRATDLSAFDGLTFATSGAATAQINHTQMPADADITGNGSFADTLEIFVGAGATFTAAGYVFATWSVASDLVVFRDNTGNETITGTGQNDRIHVTTGNDTVNGGTGDDLLVLDYAADNDGFDMNGATQINDFVNTSVTFSNIDRFDASFGSGNDNIVLLGGNDTVNGGGGNDSLNTAAGAAIVDGGAGTDVWSADLSAFSGAFTLDLNVAGLQNIGNGSSVVNIEGLNVTGGTGNDTFITPGSGAAIVLNETLNGFDGNDTLGVGAGNDTVNGGNGDDLLILDYATDNDGFDMNGATQINDFVNTSVTFSSIEHFDASFGAGNDNVVLLGGNDTVDGGDGNDNLNTAAGAAIVDGGNGTNVWSADLSAFSGAFTLDLNVAGLQNIGNGSSVVNIEGLNVTGGTGDDTFLTPGSGAAIVLNETLNGFDGNDTLGVGAGNDTVNGGNGDDLVILDYSTDNDGFDMNGANQINDFANTSVTFSNIERFDASFGAGDDSIVLLAGNDTVDGGGGNDVLNTATGAATVDGGAGTDVWSADLSAFSGAFTLDLNVAGLQNIGNGSSVVNIEGLNVTGGTGNDTFITPGSGAAIVLNETLNGLDGNDTLGVGAGNDTVDGGTGDDLLILDYSADDDGFDMNGAAQINDFANTGVSFSNIERFDASFGLGNDNIVLLGGNDTVDGGGGNDSLNTAGGAAIVDGGAGIDVWSADLSAFGAAFTLDLNIAGSQNIGNGSTVVNIEGLNVTGGTGNDTFLTLGSGAGIAINETLNGFDGNDTLGVGSGNDNVNGGTGDDLLVLDYAADNDGFDMNGASQINDFLNTSVTFSNIERFDASFGAGNDNITLLGGNDIVRLGAGTNSVNLGAGDDLWVAGPGNDTVNGNTGSDTGDCRTATGNLTVSLAAVGAQAVGGGFGTSNLQNMENLLGGGFDDALTGNGSDNLLRGGAGNDALDGGAAGSDTADYSDAAGAVTVSLLIAGAQAVGGGLGSDTLTNIDNLTGGGSGDTLTGDNNANILSGGLGADVLTGNDGDDTLDGGSGNDTMTGGLGDDLYSVSAAGDSVTEAGAGGTDTVNSSITYTLGANVERLKLVSANAIDGTGNGGGNFIDGNAAANVLTGLGGADRLDGKGGADTMIGGAGDEIYYIDTAGDVVTELAGEGTDLVRSLLAINLNTLANVENATLLTSAAVNITGNGAANVLTGGNGANQINGSGGADTIRGGFGVDRLIGGAAADTFVYLGVNESSASSRDRIDDFLSGTDKLDVSGIDANTATGGDDAFVLDLDNSLSTGEIRLTVQGADLLLEGNADADAAAELHILFKNIGSLAAGDFFF